MSIRRSIFAAAAAVAFLFAGPASASAQGTSVFILAGIANGTGDYGDVTNLGWMTAAGLSFDIGESGVFAGVEGLYSRAGTDIDGLSAAPYSAMGFLGYNVQTGSSVTPYIFAGAGLQGVRVSFDGDSESDSAFGYQFGAGAAFGTSGNVTPLVEVRYQGSGDENVDLNFFGLSVGASIGLGGDRGVDM